jgi:hypothetical protein
MQVMLVLVQVSLKHELKTASPQIRMLGPSSIITEESGKSIFQDVWS